MEIAVIISISQLQKTDLVTIRQKRFSQLLAFLFFQSLCFSDLFCCFHYSIPQVYLSVCVCVFSTPFPRYLGGEGPSVGFLLSLLRGPQRLLIIPDLLALPLSASHSGPLWLVQVSSLPMLSFSALFALLHVQNNPSAGLQSLIAAISETKTMFGARQSWRSVKEKGSNNTCVSVKAVWVFGITLLWQAQLFVSRCSICGEKWCFKTSHQMPAKEREQAGMIAGQTGLLLLLKTKNCLIFQA